MNYYDELGVSAHATAEQIKEAYRALMRLLHPDHHPDPQLQHVAEQQVKKLNRIYGILSDPERRRLYDRELAEGVERATPIIIHAPPPPQQRGMINRSSAAWISAVTLFAILLIWMASRPIPTANVYNATEPASRADAGAGARPIQPGEPIPQPPPQREQPAPVVQPPVTQPVSSPPVPAQSSAAIASNGESQVLKSRLAETQGERDAALAELTRLQSRLAAEKENGPTQHELRELRQARQREAAASQTLAEAKTEVKNADKPVLTAKISPAPPPPDIPMVIRNPIAGSWTYRKPAVPPKNKDLYPPEFIETTITEENGQLHGTYRARYQAPNRPVSPEVSFQFAGKLSGDSGSLPWNGVGGSKGEVTLKLTADHSLKVDWTASQLGPLGFYRGTAVLVKKSD